MKPKQILTIVLIVAAGIYFAINAKEQMNKIENNYETAANDPLNARIYTLDNGLKVYLTHNLFPLQGEILDKNLKVHHRTKWANSCKHFLSMDVLNSISRGCSVISLLFSQKK